MANQTCNPSILTQALGITATGPRTVIVLADPIIWDAETSYEYLTLVASTDFGQGYLSKRDVPAGTPLTNTDYWIPVASFNAQLAAIQQQLGSVQTDVDSITDKVTEMSDRVSAICYRIEDYRQEGDADDSQAFERMLTDIKASGAPATVLGNGSYSGSLTLDQTDVTFVGGTFTGTMTVDLQASGNDTPSNVTFNGCVFDTGDANGLVLTCGTGIKVTGCEFKQTVNGSGIYAKAMPTAHQQLKQTIISNCRFYGGYAVYLESLNTSAGPGYMYLSADTTITNCEMVNLLGNVYMVGADGFVISNNTMFLSLGGSNKMDNIYADFVSMPVITGNQLFEAGRSGVHLGTGQNGNVSTNNIVWPGQYVQAPAIYVGEGTVGGQNNLAVMTITGNIIDHPTGDGIYCAKSLVSMFGNSVAYSGSSDHWKGTGELTTPTYAINATQTNVTALCNNTTGSAGFNFLDSKDLANDVSLLNFGRGNFYQADYQYFGFDKPLQITNETQIKYKSQMPLLLIVNQSSIDESVIKGDASTWPKLGCVMCYTQPCTIGTHTLQPQKPELFLLYGGDIHWISTQYS